MIEKATARPSPLTRQLLTFAKGGVPVRTSTNVVQIVRGAAELAASGSNVQCQFDLPAESCMVTGDEGQLAQVFQNLVRNAVDAMPRGGVVGVQVSRQAARAQKTGAQTAVGAACALAAHRWGASPAGP